MKKRRIPNGNGSKGQRNFKFINLKKEGERYEEAFVRRDMVKCQQILATILKASPEHIETRLQKARLMGVMCRFSEARDQFVKTIQTAPADKRSIVAVYAANLARDLYDPCIAEHLYQMAISAGCPAEGRLMYAEHLMRMRRHTEAMEQIQSVLNKTPKQAHARLLKARIVSESADEQVKELRALSSEEQANPRVAILADYELAKFLDGESDYDGAMEALIKAKELLRKEAHRFLPTRRANRPGLVNTALEFDVVRMQEWKKKRFKPLSGIERIGLIVGHPRSGTTLLEQIVDSHPKTQSAEETENFMISAILPLVGKGVNMYDGSMVEALDDLQSSQIDAARKSYRSSIGRLMSIAQETSLLVDKNPSLSPMVVPFARIFPEARIIAMIRDPRDVVLSCFFQPMLPLNPVSSTWTDLEEAAAEYADVMQAYIKSAEVLEESVMELRYEDLVDDVEVSARQVTEFLGQPWEPSVLDFHKRASEKIVRSPTADAVTENVHTRAKARWKNYEKHLEPCMKHLEPFIEHWGYH